MKYLFKILAAFLIASSTYAQTGKGTTTPHASAQLEVSSTTKWVFTAAEVTSRKGCYSKPGYRRLLNRSSQLVLHWRNRVLLRIGKEVFSSEVITNMYTHFFTGRVDSYDP